MSHDIDIASELNLNGRTVLITGGASGLGLAMVGYLAAAGAKVVAVGSRPPDKAEPELARHRGNIVYRQCDILDHEAAKTLIDSIGRIDILVNNAGNHCKKPIEDMAVADFTGVLGLHLTAGFVLTKLVVPGMKKVGRGCVLFMASMGSFIGMTNVVGYSAAKAGVLGMVHCLASELGPSGIRVNAIAPGWINTAMARKAIEGDAERKAKIFGRIPTRKLGEPNDIGMAALFLCSDAAKYINGVCLPVDGGGLIGF